MLERAGEKKKGELSPLLVVRLTYMCEMKSQNVSLLTNIFDVHANATT